MPGAEKCVQKVRRMRGPYEGVTSILIQGGGSRTSDAGTCSEIFNREVRERGSVVSTGFMVRVFLTGDSASDHCGFRRLDVPPAGICSQVGLARPGVPPRIS